MATLDIEGVGRVQVGDEFRTMSPEDQQAFVAYIADQAGKGVKSYLGGTAPAEAATSLPPVPDSMGLSSGDMAGDAKANADIARSIFNGATLGAGPRIIAGAKALFGAGSYDENLADQRAKADAFHKAAGSFDTGMNVVGGLTGAVAGGAGLAAAGVRAALPASTLGKMAVGGVTGAGLGAVQGANESPDWTNPGQTAKDAGLGAALGAATGAAIPAAAKGIGAGYGAIRGILAPEVPGGVSRASYGLLTQHIGTDGVPAVEQRLAALGPDAMLPDAGPSTLGLAQGVVGRPGTAKSVIAKALDRRNEGMADRLAEDVNAALGPAESPAAKIAEIQDFRQGVTSPSYDQAFGRGILWNPELDALSQRPAVSSGLRKAGEIAANEGRPLSSVILDDTGQQVTPQARQAYDAFTASTRPRLDQALGQLLGNGGSLSTADQIISRRAAEAGPLYDAARSATIPDGAMPIDLLPRLRRAGAFSQAVQKMSVQGEPFDIGQVQAWDYMKRALDDRIGAAVRKGSNDDARIYQGLKGELTDAIDAAVPQWAQARQTFAGHFEMLDALRSGADAFKGNTSREQLARDFGALGTDGEREMFRLGASNALREKLAQTGDNKDLVGALSGNQALRDKLAVLAPSPEALANFNDILAQHGREFTEATRPDVRGWKLAADVIGNKAAGATGDEQAALQSAHQALTGQLNQIPAFARAASKDAEYGRLADAVGQGGQILRGGESAIRPDDFARSVQAMSPAEREAMRVGARAEVDRQLGTKANDLAALKSALQGEGGWNTQKLSTLYPPEAVNRVTGAVDREAAFRNTHTKLIGGSETEPRTAAREALADKPPLELPLINPNMSTLGLLAAGAKKAATTGMGLLARSNNAARDAELGGLLALQGPERDALLGSLKAALEREALRNQTGQTIGNAIAVPSGLLAYDAGRRK